MTRRALLSVVALACSGLALGACRSDVGAAPRPAAPAAPRSPKQTPTPTPAQAPTPGAESLVNDPGDVVLGELDRLLVRWDVAQSEGSLGEAETLAAELTQRVAAEHALVLSAARGARGQAGRYVGTMALGFSRSGEATTALVELLAVHDPRLVANALIAIKMRADPATPLEPLVGHLASSRHDVRRYAPLAFAHVLDARRRLRIPPDGALETRALPRLVSGAKDQESVVRLHVARGLGALSILGSEPTLLALLDDPSRRVGLGAARALAERGSPDGFSGVVRLLHQVQPEAKPLVAAVLVLYAEKLRGRPLSGEEQQALGTDVLAWSRWHGSFVRAQDAAARPAAAR